MGLTIIIGFGITPEMLLPYCGTGLVKGFYQVLGPLGGNVAVRLL
jgi:hypothetical protein